MATKYVWPLATAALVVLAGVALLIWPFALHTNVGGWTSATTSDFWSGLGVIVVGLLMVMGWLTGLQQELVRAGVIEVRRREPATVPPQASAPQAGMPGYGTPSANADLDQLLRPLAETVLRDLSAQLAAKEGRGGGGPVA
ncbi:MAG: hypothetical protein OWU84_01790 [Firmicutes bacterium]|nr:hypothetical protein [Bacillota bacterium]